MTVLLHLNGPSGVGKSTLAQKYVDEHPGVLDLDIDRVVTLIGGWKRDFGATLAPARRLAIAMGKAHLESGHDVVMPQLVTDLEQARRFEEAAAEVGADYVEVALLVDQVEQVQRFREKPQSEELDVQVRRYIEDRGGQSVLERINHHFMRYLVQRPLARRLTTDRIGVGPTYDALVALLRS